MKVPLPWRFPRYPPQLHSLPGCRSQDRQCALIRLCLGNTLLLSLAARQTCDPVKRLSQRSDRGRGACLLCNPWVAELHKFPPLPLPRLHKGALGPASALVYRVRSPVLRTHGSLPCAGTCASTARSLTWHSLWTARLQWSLLDSRHLRQNIENNRKILFHQPHPARRRQKFIGHRRRRHGHVQLSPQLQCQIHVFLHHVYVEPRLFGHLQNERTSILHHGRSNHAVRQDIHRRFARNTTLFRKQNPLRERQHLHREAQVRADLHHQREAVVPDVGYFWPEVFQQPLHFFERFLAPSYHHRQFPFLQCDDAPGNRRVHHVAALFPHLGRHLPAVCWANGAHIHQNLARRHSRKHSIGSVHHRAKRYGIGDHRKGNVGCGDHGARRVGPLHPLLDQPLRFRTRTVVARSGVALPEQPVHHFAAHHAKNDKSKIRHEPFLSSLKGSSNLLTLPGLSDAFCCAALERGLLNLDRSAHFKSLRENACTNHNLFLLPKELQK